MKLSIIITHYKEPMEVGRALFDSIALQQGFNFTDMEVVLVNDGDECVLEESNFADYPYKVTYLVKEKQGVSSARNYGLDHCNGDYVMFCDFDDMFLNMYGLHMIDLGMNEGFDTLSSSFIEEQIGKNGEYKMFSHEYKDGTFIHGKVHNKKFLMDNNLRFADELTIHEDGYFHVIVNCVAKKKKTVTTPFYLWKCNPNSVVRKDAEAFVLKTYDHLMKSRLRCVEELERRGLTQERNEVIIKTVMDSYYDFQKPEYLAKGNKALRDKGEKAFKEFYVKYRRIYNQQNIDLVASISMLARSNAYTQGFHIEQYTITDWLNHIMKEV